jgi:PAS domain S-box-containing protein
MFAVFLLVPPRRWWMYLLAAAPAHLAVQMQHGMPLAPMLLLFVTNCGDGLLGAVAVRRFTGPCTHRFDGFRNVLTFLAFAIAAPLVVSFFDAAVLALTTWNASYWQVWQTRFRSNILTNVIWVPAIVICVTRGRIWLRDARPKRYAEAALLLVALSLVGSLVFGGPSLGSAVEPLLFYVPLPLLLWAAVRFGTGAVSVSLLILAFLIIRNASQGLGPFTGTSPNVAVVTLQVFLTLLSMPSLLLAALLQERRRAADALAEREAEYRSIFESTSDGVLITDLEHTVVAANPAFCRLTGYTIDRLRATHPRSFFHLADLRPFDSYLTQASARDATVAQATCVREDGGLSLFEIRGQRFSYGGMAHVLSVVREVTERERAYQELERRVAERTRELTTLLDISKTVASTLELRPLLEVVLEQLRMILQYTGATIFIRENDEADLIILAHQGPLDPEHVSAARISAADASRCPTLNQGAPIVLDDLRGDSPAVKAHRAATPEAVIQLFAYARSALLVPLKARDHVIGVLRIDSIEPNRYTMRDAELALALASQAAIAIENARLYDQARELAAFEERQRLARELHDSVTQTLCAVAMLGRILPEAWARNPEEGRRSVANLEEMTQSALAEMRTLLLELRPDTLLEANLGDLLQQLAEALRSRSRAPIEVEVEGGARLPAEVHVTLYRVAQEALANASTHASAPRVRVRLEYSEGAAALTIRDDGVGFSEAEIPPGHLGMLIMRERAQAIGGVLTVDSAPGRGTAVTLVWRKPEQNPSAGDQRPKPPRNETRP